MPGIDLGGIAIRSRVQLWIAKQFGRWFDRGAVLHDTQAYVGDLGDPTGYAGAAAAAAAIDDTSLGVRLSPLVYDRDMNITFNYVAHIAAGVILRPPAGRTYILPITPDARHAFVDVSNGGDVIFLEGFVRSEWIIAPDVGAAINIAQWCLPGTGGKVATRGGTHPFSTMMHLNRNHIEYNFDSGCVLQWTGGASLALKASTPWSMESIYTFISGCPVLEGPALDVVGYDGIQIGDDIEVAHHFACDGMQVRDFYDNVIVKRAYYVSMQRMDIYRARNRNLHVTANANSCNFDKISCRGFGISRYNLLVDGQESNSYSNRFNGMTCEGATIQQADAVGGTRSILDDIYTESHPVHILTGSITFTQGNDQVTASGGAFLTEIQVGQYVKAATHPSKWYMRVKSIQSNNALTLVSAYIGSDATDVVGMVGAGNIRLAATLDWIGLTGVISFENGSDQVTGIGSFFLNAGQVGSPGKPVKAFGHANIHAAIVASIESDTVMTLAAPYTGPDSFGGIGLVGGEFPGRGHVVNNPETSWSLPVTIVPGYDYGVVGLFIENGYGCALHAKVMEGSVIVLPAAQYTQLDAMVYANGYEDKGLHTRFDDAHTNYRKQSNRRYHRFHGGSLLLEDTDGGGYQNTGAHTASGAGPGVSFPNAGFWYSYIQIGFYGFWIDSAGNYRKKNVVGLGHPTHETDGDIV